ncbi:MAG: alginate lyase family protein [Butyrivibrio sp.]|nr:alginate lyase family protein [Butyrivibrio sp.]
MNLVRLFWTVIKLKPIQIAYQIKYRTIGYTRIKTIDYSEIDIEKDISIKALDEDEIYVLRFRPEELLMNHVWLLNDMEEWHQGKWKYPERTHLWNFNLHYFEYGIALASKFKNTNDARYYQKLEEMYTDWHKSCFKEIGGDAWHPYTISLRIRNLLIIYGVLDKKKEEWLNLVKKDIFWQYQFLVHNQEKNLLGNHYFENLTTLYICSKFFKDRQRNAGFNRELLAQIKEQILPDGMHFERSFMYHNLVLEDLIRIYKVADDMSKQLLKPYIQAMSDCVNSFEEEFRLPLFNDCGSNVAKRKSQLLTAAENIADIKAILRKSLYNGGYYRLEDGKISVVVDAGIYAPEYISGHGHCDMMSFELFYDGEPIIVNAGTFQYQTEYREKFRSTVSHNTMQVEGTEQSEIWGEHRTGRTAKVLKISRAEQFIEAVFRDYKCNILKRKIVLDHGIIVEDMSDKSSISFWHIYPKNKVRQISGNEIEVITSKGNKLYLWAEGGNFDDITENSMYSEEFGKIQKLPAFSTRAYKVIINKKSEEENG